MGYLVTDSIAQRPARFTATWVEVLISSLLGMVASVVLSVDAIVLAVNPNADLGCNISASISCGTVGTSWQAHLLGEHFPNAFLGMLCEPVITTIAIASLAGVRFPRWFMIAAQAVSTVGFVFAYWLFYQAYFEIHALCPWCLLITGTTTLIFFAFTRVNVLDGHYGSRLQARGERALRVYHADTLVAVLLIAIVTAMVMARYL